MMHKLLATAALTVSAAALAAPAHADDAHWTATGTGRCVGKLVVMPVVKATTPVPLADTPTPACGPESLINSAG